MSKHFFPHSETIEIISESHSQSKFLLTLSIHSPFFFLSKQFNLREGIILSYILLHDIIIKGTQEWKKRINKGYVENMLLRVSEIY